MPNTKEECIVQNILSSRKYRSVYPATVRRIATDSLKKYGPEKAEDEARNILHRIWGAYYGIRPSFDKILKKFRMSLKGGMERHIALEKILALQSSTRERIPILTEFYQRIFAITGVPERIIDEGCGLNPLTVPWMNLPKTSVYTGRDIDVQEVEFMRKVLELSSASCKVKLEAGDVYDEPKSADVVFLLKLLPPLEQQKKGLGLRVMQRQKCRHLVVSYPVASISGGKRRMEEFYANQFHEMVSRERWTYEKLSFSTELVFVVEKR